MRLSTSHLQSPMFVVVVLWFYGVSMCLADNKEESNLIDYDSSMPSAITSTNLDERIINSGQFECGSEENFVQGNFTLYDYSVVFGMLVISLGIGVFYGFYNKSVDFLHGSDMKLFPVTLSLTTSFITAIELLGNPSEMFFNGTQYSLIVFSMILVIPVALKVFYPIYFKLNLTSCYEYLGIRFGKDIRIFGAVLYIIQMCFYTAVSVYAPAIALSKATGLNTRLAVFLIYLVCIFYSSQGGIKAVVIADTFQAGVLAFSLILVIILGYFYTTGFSEIFQTAADTQRIEFFNLDPNPITRHTVFSVVIGGFFYWTSLLCTNQASVQKCMSLKSIKKSNLALIYSTIGLILVFIINFFTGLMVFNHYANCDPVKAGQINEKDELLPFYIMDVFGHLQFVNGIFVAGIFAASLGTVASALNSLSAVTSEDILTTGLNIKINPEKASLYIKWMSLGYGVFSFALVFLVEQLGGILQATLTLNGLIGGVTLGLFSLGIFFKSSNSRGALLGGMLALLLVIYLGVMAQINNIDTVPLPTRMVDCNCYINETMTSLMDDTKEHGTNTSPDVPQIFRISYMWYSLMGTLLTVIFGLIISIVTNHLSKTKILNLKSSTNGNEKPTHPISTLQTLPILTFNKDCETIYMVDKYRKLSLRHSMNGIDNPGLRVEEA